MMSLPRIFNFSWVLILICNESCADSYDFFAEPYQDDTINLDINLENTDLNQEQKRLAEQHDQEENNYKVLKNLFYSNERISVYNYTAYNMSDLKNKVIDGSTDHLGVSDLSISFGYGLSYQLRQDTRLGYEYISSFPYNRGQLIRFFWIRSF